MRRDQLYELHYITPVSNLPSILREGILCNQASRRHGHASVAMPEIQERRSFKTVPGGRRLHDYACLYLHARNPMLYKRKDRHAELCILRVSTDVLELPEVVITSQNASSDYVRFYSAPDGLKYLDYELVFAEYWTHPDDPIEEYRHKSIKCAEVLVPDRVRLDYIFGAYVSNPDTRTIVETHARLAGHPLEVVVDRHLFFLGSRP